MSHDEKFRSLMDAIEKAVNSQYNEIVVSRPEALGDTYEEIVENLNRIADSGVRLTIVPRRGRRPPAQS